MPVDGDKEDPEHESVREFLFTHDSFELFEFILRHGSHNIVWTFNIGWDFAQCMKQHLVELERRKGKKAVEDEVKSGRYLLEKGGKKLTVKYVEGKFFMVSDGAHKQAYVYDVFPFFKDSEEASSSLDYVALHVLGYGKERFGVSENEIDIEHPENEPLWRLVKRCSVDALLTVKVGEALRDEAKKLGVEPRRLNSPASLAKENIIKRGADDMFRQMPLTDTGLGALEYGFRAFKGGLFNALVKGRLEGVQEADIVSAYPWAMCQLPDTKYGKWHEVDEITESAAYGVYCVLHEFDGFQPMKGRSGRVYYPNSGNRMLFDYVTAPEVKWFQRRGLKVVVLHGFEFWHDADTPVEYPLSDCLMPWFDLKTEAAREHNYPKKQLAKLVLNSSFGATVESKHGIGVLFQSVLGAYITALVRIKVVEWAEQNCLPGEIYEFATDAVFGKFKPDAKFTATKELGAFELKEDLPSTFIEVATGFTLSTGGQVLRSRGVARKQVNGKKPGVVVEFQDKSLKMTARHAWKTKETLRRDDLSVKDIGKFVSLGKNFRYNTDEKNWADTHLTKDKLLAQKITSTPIRHTQLVFRGELGEDEEEAEWGDTRQLEEVGALLFFKRDIALKLDAIKEAMRLRQERSDANKQFWKKVRAQKQQAEPTPSHTPGAALPSPPPSANTTASIC